MSREKINKGVETQEIVRGADAGSTPNFQAPDSKQKQKLRFEYETSTYYCKYCKTMPLMEFLKYTSSLGFDVNVSNIYKILEKLSIL
jgi:hypothetical protein